MGTGSQQGFTVTDTGTGACKVRLDGEIFDYIPGEETADVPDGIAKIIGAVLDRYEYLL
jgi:putative selenate reductase